MQAWKLKTNVSVDLLEEEADALSASHFSIGHVALGVALGYIDFRFPQMNWRNGHPSSPPGTRPSRRGRRSKANEPVDEP